VVGDQWSVVGGIAEFGGISRGAIAVVAVRKKAVDLAVREFL
jgi:hypothetical protein